MIKSLLKKRKNLLEKILFGFGHQTHTLPINFLHFFQILIKIKLKNSKALILMEA